jgi:hypothetical protein
MYQPMIENIHQLLKKDDWKEAVRQALQIPVPAGNPAYEFQQQLKQAFDQHLYYDAVGSMHHLDYLADKHENTEALHEFLTALEQAG